MSDDSGRWSRPQPADAADRSVNAAPEELAAGNRWMIGLRWIASASIVLVTLFAREALGLPIPIRILVGIALGVAAYNAVLLLTLARITRAGSTPWLPLVVLAHAQIALDLVALAGVLHFAGRAGGPFCVYFVFHTIIASILLTRGAAYAQAGLAFLLYAGFVFGAEGGLGALLRIPAVGSLEIDAHALAQLAAFGSALAISVFLTSTISNKLRQREADLAAALDDIGRHVRERAAAYERLRQTQEMQLRYMHRVSHELRAPLAGIAMTLRVVLRGLTGEMPGKQREMITRAETRTQTALDMVTDLLTLSSVRDATVRIGEGEVAVAELVQGAVDFFADEASARSLHVTVDLPENLPPIYGQAEGLRTMLLNLVGNAVKYTPDGGSITVAAQAQSSELVIRVSDTGIGIAEEDTARIFDEFYRTPAARETGAHGTGLGLTIVSSVVKAHHGEITVKSELGRGSTFEVRLPVARPQASEDPAE